MKGILLQAVAACIFMSGTFGSAYSATGDSTTITLTINVTARTCQFDKTSQSVELNPVRTEDFLNASNVIAIKEVPVGISCSSNVDTVKIKVKGTAAYFSTNEGGGVGGIGIPDLFKNTGTAKNIGLAFMDKDENSLISMPAGSSGSDHVVVELENGQATYVFKAGYRAMSDFPVTGGSFASSVNLTFDYD
ncbi:type 1 fimbrial protein [Enterobacter cloacae]|uniref:fimbrial protein n=1 Tax=Enterobacter cloacae TaxID=550 RepID=UPI000E51E43E|nr:fimbrial protein [Enterobacter cloacae]RHH96550.1 type 1 fimbrial protein [Enterobacter cloacae]